VAQPRAKLVSLRAQGEHLHSWSGPDIGRPRALAVVGEVLFVVDGGDQDPDDPAGRIVVLSTDGQLLTHLSGPGTGPGLLAEPHDIALDSKGRAYVAELATNGVQRFHAELPAH
jgi:hypothetical protein